MSVVLVARFWIVLLIGTGGSSIFSSWCWLVGCWTLSVNLWWGHLMVERVRFPLFILSWESSNASFLWPNSLRRIVTAWMPTGDPWCGLFQSRGISFRDEALHLSFVLVFCFSSSPINMWQLIRVRTTLLFVILQSNTLRPTYLTCIWHILIAAMCLQADLCS